MVTKRPSKMFIVLLSSNFIANFLRAVFNEVRKANQTMSSCSLEQSGPLKFISTESLPDSNGLSLHGRIWTFPNQKSKFSSLLHIG